MDQANRFRQRRRCSLRAFARDHRAATAVEYGLIVALIVLAVFGAIAALGSRTSTIWNNVQTAVANAH